MKLEAGYLQYLFITFILIWFSVPAFSGLPEPKIFENTQLQELPVPYQVYSHLKEVQVMSLREAILLSLRYNITIRNSELDRIVQKYTVAFARWEFEPRYGLRGSALYNKHTKPIYTLSPEVSLMNTYGTKVTASTENTFQNGNEALSVGRLRIEQPLIRGSGRDIVLINLRNTLDGDIQNRLALKRQLMQTITDVIAQYYQTLQNYNVLKVEKYSLERSEQNLKDVKLRVEVGKRPISELTRQQGDIAGQRLAFETRQVEVKDALQSLLQLIGLDPDAKLNIDEQINLELEAVPNLEESVKIALKHNPDYLSELVQLRILERNLIQAKDNKRWSLNLTAEGSSQLGSRNWPEERSVYSTRMAMLNLEVPVDDLSIDQAIANARVNLQRQKYSLREAKQALTTNVINAVRNIQTARSQVEIAEKNYQYRKKVYEDSLLAWQYGKTTYFQVIQDQTDWRDSGIELVNTKIAYISLLAGLDNLLGITLDRWGIKVDY